MRFGPLAVSLTVHALALGLLVMPGAQRRPAPPPAPPPSMTVALIELAKIQPKVQTVDVGTIQYPKKKRKAPVPKQVEKPKPVKLAARPAPAPTPTPRPDDKERKVFDALRKYKEYAGLTDEQIRKMPLPPGMKDWKEVLAMTENLNQLDWTLAPPDTGDKAATASAGGFFGWAPPGVGPFAGSMGTVAARTQEGATWRYAFAYFGTVLAAEWTEGAGVAKVVYYQDGAKPDPAKTFDIPVRPTDEELSAEMIAQYSLIAMGMPPQPVPTSTVSSK